jgi:hypothetical protein
MKNGQLLDAAEAAGFDVLIGADQNIADQQNLTGRKTLDFDPLRTDQSPRSVLVLALAVTAALSSLGRALF